MTPEDLQFQPLLSSPKEDLTLEVKNWLDLTKDEDRADLAKALIAIANTGGGYVILGFDDKTGKPANGRPSDLHASYPADAVGDALKKHADPVFQCRMHFPKRAEDNFEYPVISIPGNHPIPIRCRKGGPDNRHLQINKYYIRKPKPESIEVQDSKDWDDLIRRCVLSHRSELVSAIRGVIEGIPTQPLKTDLDLLSEFAAQSSERLEKLQENGEFPAFRKGYCRAAYALIGHLPFQTLSQARDALAPARVGQRLTFFDLSPCPDFFPEFAWRPFENCSEQVINEGNGDGIASPSAKFNRLGLPFVLCSLSPLLEDDPLYAKQDEHDPQKWQVGKVLEMEMAFRRALDLCVHARRIAIPLGDAVEKAVFVLDTFETKGRLLIRRDDYGRIVGNGACQQHSISVGPLEFDIRALRDNMAECVDVIFRQMINPFGFQGDMLSSDYVPKQLAVLASHNVPTL